MKKPNIILITAHDLGTNLSCYGHSWVESPHLDHFAAEGARFASHFSPSAYCSPSRGAIVTGQAPHVNGLMGLCGLGGWSLSEDIPTIERVLKPAGYETLLIGLQHEVNEEQRDTLGFDVDSGQIFGEGSEIPNLSENVVPEAMRLLSERAGSDKPFLARIGLQDCHTHYQNSDGTFTFEHYADQACDAEDVQPLPFLKDTPLMRSDLAKYRGCIHHMDQQLGRLFAMLDESGLSENSLVIFTTDHGMPFPRAKGTLYDPGTHVALMMRWPRAFAGGQVHDLLTSHIDILPTILDAAGADVPAGVEGVSLLPLLRGNDDRPVRRCIYCEESTIPDSVIRSVRTPTHKYIVNFVPGPSVQLAEAEFMPLRPELGDAHLAPRPMTELYDLVADPWETQNLSGQPDVRAIERELSEMLADWMLETRDPALKGGIPRMPGEVDRWSGFYKRKLRVQPDGTFDVFDM